MSHNQDSNNLLRGLDKLSCSTCPLNRFLSEGITKQPELLCINKGVLGTHPCCAYLVMNYIAFDCRDIDSFVNALRQLLSK